MHNKGSTHTHTTQDEIVTKRNVIVYLKSGNKRKRVNYKHELQATLLPTTARNLKSFQKFKFSPLFLRP